MDSKYIKELDEKLTIDGSESVLIQDNDGTKQLNINTLVNTVNNNIDLTSYATKSYVDESVNNIDLTSYATKSYVDSVINNQNQSADIPDIVKLNKENEPLILNASRGRISKYNDATPLTFVHFSDIHKQQDLWNRIMDYINYYHYYIEFGIHTGDYCLENLDTYIDLYANGTKCVKPIFNCLGNHDIYNSDGTMNKQGAYNKIFNHRSDWNVKFITGVSVSYPLSYYKDFDASKIRLIVLNSYFDIDAQCTWLTARLNEAKSLGYHVITCCHEKTNALTNKLNTPFNTIDNKFEGKTTYKFDSVIGNWIKSGGIHVANLCGHEHTDYIGYTTNGVLNICVEAGTNNMFWIDGKRIEGTKTYDCFNVVSVEQGTGMLKIVRIGNNYNHYLMDKTLFCYDYINKNIISSR